MEVLAQEAYNIGKIKCAENLLKKKGRDFRLFYLFTAEQLSALSLLSVVMFFKLTFIVKRPYGDVIMLTCRALGAFALVALPKASDSLKGGKWSHVVKMTRGSLG
ncbi:hypothetical protein D0Y65_051290 [Glycine soja]|uniref:Uncharacterized protein n=1 Tax=Glycine soja TaxID=3848 RepID=A0A445FFK2_GLYSO|nr:hypothetical protein D0Y65_051290 [Glycine soja]RZB47639.1 hypothetical protein D0Y65_051290 [Glycine soja]